jgi:hypothetical protein
LGGYVVADQLGCYRGGKFDKTVFCAPERWIRWDGGVGACAAYLRRYKDGHNFFSVLWQINTPAGQANNPDSTRRVDLRVEAPRYEVDSVLNDLKLAVINALLRSNLRSVVSRGGFRYEVGTLASDVHIRKNKSTTVFKVQLDGNQIRSSSQETIEVVHDAIGAQVDSILRPFLVRLGERFAG